MKKCFFYITLLSVVFFITNTAKANGHHKYKKSNPKSIIDSAKCTCGNPTILSVNSSGGTTTVTWSAVAGVTTYTYGGYYRSGTPPTFSGCLSGTSASWPTGAHGTFVIQSICEGGTCAYHPCTGSSGGHSF